MPKLDQLRKPRTAGSRGSSFALAAGHDRCGPTAFEASLRQDVRQDWIAQEKLLRALLLQALYSVRNDRMLMEELDYNLLFRWFVGLNMDDPIGGRDRVH